MGIGALAAIVAVLDVLLVVVPRDADHDVGVVQREVGLAALEVWSLRAVRDEEFEVFSVGRKQRQRAETGGADRVALGDGLGGIADGVKRGGGLALHLRQAGHFGG